MAGISPVSDSDSNFSKFKATSQGTNLLEAASGLKTKPTPRNGQIWMIKNAYEDYFTNHVESVIPLIVLIVDSNEKLEHELFCRVQPISQFVHYVSLDDYKVDDASIVGFPFLVETWNEQPVLNELLDYCIGSIDINQYLPNHKVQLSEDQVFFRELENLNTEYLRSSVLRYLAFLEQRQTEDTGIIINIDSTIYKPAFFVDDKRFDEFYNMAAKTGLDNSNKYFEFIHKADSYEVKFRIKRIIDDFVLSIYTDDQVLLKNSMDSSITGKKAEGRIIFSMLKPGLYYLEHKDSLTKLRLY